MTDTTVFDKFFRNSEGEIVIAQPPNLPIIIWFAATFLQLILTTGKIHTLLDAIAFGSLFTWAWLEIFEGVNYFRKTLGFCVLIAAIASRIW